ncbi:SIMPL domain-containing protein [Candidatus Shapirobacteria bacterium]|nr:SIMPL domain-containing protein [Candidatus Shapirobacteria bacterium]
MINQEITSVVKGFKDKGLLLNALLAVLVIFVATLTVSAVAGIQNKIKEGKYIGQEIETKNTLAVSGRGEVYGKPDLALISFSVVAEAKTVAEAMAQNSQKMNAVIKFVKSQGVEEKDLKTTTFSLRPRYEWRENLSSQRQLVGYEARQELEAKVREMEKIGSLIEGTAAAGANQLGDLQFMIDNREELEKEAREKAVKDAKDKAKELASLLGVNLVRITNFSEESQIPRPYALESLATVDMKGAVETPQIEAGENKIEITVTLTYEIN